MGPVRFGNCEKVLGFRSVLEGCEAEMVTGWKLWIGAGESEVVGGVRGCTVGIEREELEKKKACEVEGCGRFAEYSKK